MLAYLIEHRDRVVLRQELFDRLWADRFVSDAALERCMAVIRRAVGDSGQRQRVIGAWAGIPVYRAAHRRAQRGWATYRPCAAPSLPKSVPEPPSGTVTFLFSDLETSTRLLQHLGDRYAEVLAAYRRLLREAFQAWDGYEIDTAGDGFFVAFQRATHAVAAVVEAQRAVAGHPWPEGAPMRVRIGLHTGEPTHAAGGYGLGRASGGTHLRRRARRADLLSQTTRALVEYDPVGRVSLRDLGEHRLKDLQRPERLYQLVMPDLPSDFHPQEPRPSCPQSARAAHAAHRAGAGQPPRVRSCGVRRCVC